MHSQCLESHVSRALNSSEATKVLGRKVLVLHKSQPLLGRKVLVLHKSHPLDGSLPGPDLQEPPVHPAAHTRREDAKFKLDLCRDLDDGCSPR